MYLSEYQAKEILARYGVPVPEGGLARTPEEAEARARALSSEKVVVKAQILAGGRGLAGGVKFAATPSGVRDEAEAMLGQRLVTEQTGPAGEVVERVYVEAAVDDRRSLYLALVIDERTGEPTLLAASEGGVAFEAKARSDPDMLHALGARCRRQRRRWRACRAFSRSSASKGRPPTTSAGWSGAWSGRPSRPTPCWSRSTRSSSAPTAGRWRSTPRW